MSTMLCAWAHVDDSAHDEYASYIAQVAAYLHTRTWHFEAEKDPALEFEDASQHNVLTIFEGTKELFDGLEKSKEQASPLSGLMKGSFKDIRIETYRYTELVSFQSQGYNGGKGQGVEPGTLMLKSATAFTDLDFLIAAKLHLQDDAISKAYFDWTKSEVMPNMLNSPEFLRARYYKAVRADVGESGAHSQREVRKNTLCFYELDSDDWLWDAFTQISESKEWRKMEASIDLEMKKWFLKACYPKIQKPSDAN